MGVQSWHRHDRQGPYQQFGDMVTLQVAQRVAEFSPDIIIAVDYSSYFAYEALVKFGIKYVKTCVGGFVIDAEGGLSLYTERMKR